jgi:hypothetical protein
MDSAGLTPLLIDAKKEYVGQLTDVLAPYVVNHITALYMATHKAKHGGTLAFQRALRDIPGWNSNTIHQHALEIQNRYTFLGDLIAACFVAYVKILSSVKLHDQKPNIRLKLPSNDTFVHKVYVHTAREFYSAPSLVKADRPTKIAIVKSAVEASVRDMLPIEDILKAYLGNTVDAEDNTLNPAEFSHDDMPLAPSQPAPAPPGPTPADLMMLQQLQASAGQGGPPPPIEGFHDPPGDHAGDHGDLGAYPDAPAPPPAPSPPPTKDPADLPLFVSEQSSPPGQHHADDTKHISLGSRHGHGDRHGDRHVPRPQDLFSDAEDDF